MSRHGQYPKSNQFPWSKVTHDTELEKSENLTVENINTKKQAQKFPSRPNYGKGVPIMLWTNYVAMSVGNLSLHRYNVTVNPECSVRRHIQVIKLFLQSPSMVQYTRGIITDFRSILLSQKKIELPNNNCEIVYRAEDEVQPRMNAKQYNVTVTFERILSISDLQDYADSTDISTIDNIKNDIVQALNILFNHYAEPTNSLATSKSRKLFPVNTKYQIKSESDFVVNVGSLEKPTYLLSDVCTVLPGQVARTKLTPQQSQKMINFCTGDPSKDTRNIQETGLESVGLRGNNRTLGNSNISFPQEGRLPSLITVPARILGAPKISYRKKEPLLSIDKRSWDLRQVHFMKTPGMGKWSCVILAESDRENPFKESKDRKDLGAAFKHAVTNVGIRYTEPVNLGVYSTVTARGVEDIKRLFKTAIARKLDWLLLILPRRIPAVIYNSIKKVGDLDSGFGITTICIDRDKLYRAKSPAQYLANVSMKLNLKLGGNNQFVKFQEFSSLNFGKTMIVGIDVTHPSPSSDKNAPSITAMVATVNSSMGQWPAVIQRQTRARQEMVSKLSHMFKSRLELWNKTNKAYLENIIVYRDGVSEGQYNTVVNDELPLLKEACKSIPAYKKGSPRLTVIIVAKRHHTRFYAPGKVPSNPGPGTVVDRGVTEARYWDFYLQSHYAIKGTARPIHYFVVHDEIFGKMENAVSELESLTQGLCYMFGRATMPVSVCTPAYYADIACKRARCYLDGLFDNPGQRETTAVDQSIIPSDLGIKLHANIRDTMFYI
ncbi:hypothetical protein Daesc_005956 [Daldinia eschscholtzii]|uniref:Piwi domain-containing protein n=1 Tax=Daldinia eschscholtzii TaxID=292717 RepID=A0AAX6MN88_9PEZI